MGKVVDMSNFDPLLDNLEKYVNKQGCTLGKDAERLKNYYIQFSIVIYMEY